MPCENRWLLCPICHGKTRIQIRPDTVLKNFPLFCPKCRETCLIAVCNGQMQSFSRESTPKLQRS